MAESDENVGNPITSTLSTDDNEGRVVKSLCMTCGEQAGQLELFFFFRRVIERLIFPLATRLLLTSIQVIKIYFRCEHYVSANNDKLPGLSDVRPFIF